MARELTILIRADGTAAVRELNKVEQGIADVTT